MDKQHLTTAIARYAINPPVRGLGAAGLLPRGWVVLETIGRRTGRPRRTPVGAGRDGAALWLVAEHGRRAGYVRNLEAYPRVRVKIGRRWHAGTARVLPDDDWSERLRTIARGRPELKLNGRIVRLMKTDPLTVRVDLDRP